MDQEEYSTLLQVLQGIPDPRKARGQRYSWLLLLALVSAALASGQKSGHAIAHWVSLHAVELRERLRPPRASMPSESTLGRALRDLDISVLEQRLARHAEYLAARSTPQGTIATASGEVLQGQALDGKEVRGVRAYGQPLHLLGLVQHGSGRVLAQVAIEAKHNEISAAPQLLAGRELGGTVTTMDAMHTQADFAQQILDQHGHYLMVVKKNQGELYDAIALLFDQPPWLPRERAAEYQVYHTTEKGHGRLERRVLETSPALCNYLDWPGVGQVMRRHYERIVLKTGEISSETTYGITSLRFTDVGAAGLEQLWRGHWTIENRVHRVRDGTMREDASQIHAGHAAHALAALRNAILNLFRQHGWDNVADALRHYAASVQDCLDLIGAAPV
jgi:predicted transposase YbfD/YdcC/urease gamma subunit